MNASQAAAEEQNNRWEEFCRCQRLESGLNLWIVVVAILNYVLSKGSYPFKVFFILEKEHLLMTCHIANPSAESLDETKKRKKVQQLIFDGF